MNIPKVKLLKLLLVQIDGLLNLMVQVQMSLCKNGQDRLVIL